MAETTSLCTRTHKEWSPEREVKCKKTKTSPTTCLLCDRCVDKTLLTFWNSVFFLQIFPILFKTTFEGSPHLDWFPLCHFRGSHLQLGLACTDLVSLDWAARQSTHSFYPLLPPTPSPTPPYPPPFLTIGRVSWRFTNTLPSSEDSPTHFRKWLNWIIGKSLVWCSYFTGVNWISSVWLRLQWV